MRKKVLCIMLLVFGLSLPPPMVFSESLVKYPSSLSSTQTVEDNFMGGGLAYPIELNHIAAVNRIKAESGYDINPTAIASKEKDRWETDNPGLELAQY